jgi:uncharacterized protein YggU (UPF0235/DUF167 family)
VRSRGRDATSSEANAAALLLIRLTAPPVDGAGNAALCRLVARRAGAPARRVSIVRGQMSRDKAVRVEGLTVDGLGLSLRAVAEALLDKTDQANARSAEEALRFQFKRRGWPLRTRAQARRARHLPERDDLARAA